MTKALSLALALLATSGCATIVNEANIPVTFTTSDGSSADCTFTNKRGMWRGDIPSTMMIRRSDDVLRYDCKTDDGRTAVGAIASEIEAEKIGASILFIDLGITDAITDKHRKYPSSFIIPIRKLSD